MSVCLHACGAPAGPPSSATTGGSHAAGGAKAEGGAALTTGGAAPAQGGVSSGGQASGGAPAATGGSIASAGGATAGGSSNGGAFGSGGTYAMGGAFASGGATAAGGRLALTGGSSAGGNSGANGGSTTGGAGAAGAGSEDTGADCVIGTLPDAGSLPTIAKLPDPFTKLDGTRLAAKADWRCRRQELKRLAEKFVYGSKPPKPQTVTGTVSSTSITVSATDNGKSSSFSASVSLPSGSGPFPAVVVLGGFGADTATIKAAGAAVINYDPFAVGKEGTGRANKQGAFYSIYGATSSTGLLMAWAWGVSRIIDVIEKSDGKLLRADGIGITGCSRYGKGAFVIGVFDQRIALTMPIESGTAGVPIVRGVPGEGAQSLSSAYGEQPWFGDAFSAFTAAPTKLPVDMHESVALVAPRGLFIMDNPHIANLGPKSASVAALAGAEVYKALGAGDNITYWSDVQDGGHCSVRPEWKDPLTKNIQKFLLKTGTFAGVMKISSKANGNLADWREWTTPAL